jgi:GAF domain-containing protein
VAAKSGEAAGLIRRDADAQLEAFREVLRAISDSPFDMDGVLGIVVERLAGLCNAKMGIIYVPDREGAYRGAAAWGVSPEHAAYERENPSPIIPGTLVGRVVLSDDLVEIEDAATDPDYAWKEGQRIGGFRTMLGVPIRKEERLIGVVGLARLEVRRFSTDEIELARTFADQAAIVIDNVRLLGTIDRQREELARYLPSTVATLISTPEGEQLLAGHRREITAVTATCAVSPPSRSRRSRKRSWASCASITRRWGRSSCAMPERWSTTLATA